MNWKEKNKIIILLEIPSIRRKKMVNQWRNELHSIKFIRYETWSLMNNWCGFYYSCLWRSIGPSFHKFAVVFLVLSSYKVSTKFSYIGERSVKSWLIINFRFIEKGKTSWRWKSRHILKSKTYQIQSIISSNSFTCSPCFTSMNKARDSRAMNAIRAGMEEWTSKTCIRFKKRTNERAYANFKLGSG